MVLLKVIARGLETKPVTNSRALQKYETTKYIFWDMSVKL